jgi:hypothetical protein
MNLMKWLRKNNTKLMAVVVIVLMVAFIGGSSFRLIFRGSGGANRAAAYYTEHGHKKKISYYDRHVAAQELEILTALRADEILASQDLRGMLLSELLFTQNRSAAAVLDLARQTIQRNQYRISDKQLSDFYRNRKVPSDIYWILLREEAAAAGMYVPNQDVGNLLAQIAPKLFDNRGYTQVMEGLTNRFDVAEKQILSTFGKLLAVLQYAQTACALENVTTSQVKHLASRSSETLNTEFVRLEASAFADKSQTPSDEALRQQFEPYKAQARGAVSEANPFGFGYRLPALVQFDYLALKLADVEAIIKRPTAEEAEQYYQQNRDRLFSEQVPTNPNDPNSPLVARPKDYAEVATTVMNQLKRQRILTRAEQILQDAKNLADAGLQPAGGENQELTLEQRRQKAGDYTQIAQDLGKKNNITLHSGRTGLLDGAAIQDDKYLSRMYLMTYGYNPVRLSQVLFSAKEFGENATVVFSTAQAEMYASLGPARDLGATSAPQLSDQIMMIARLVDARPAAAPESLDVSFSTDTLHLGDASEPAEPQNKSFSVKEQVVKDLRVRAAWETMKTKAEEFAALATKDGWDQALKQFNQLYGTQAKDNPADPNVFKLDTQMGMQRLSQEDLQVFVAQAANNPGADTFLNEVKAQGRFIDRLYALAAASGDAPPTMPQIVESTPDQSYYVLKSLSLQPLTQEEFQRTKSMLLRREEHNQIQNLAIVHLNPENILRRTSFRFAQPTDQPSEKKAGPQPEQKEASE